MDIVLQLEEVLRKEYGCSLTQLDASEEVYMINGFIGYGSRVYKSVKIIGEENIQEKKPKEYIDGTFYAEIMRHNANPDKYLISVWNIIAWKGDNYLFSVRLYTNDPDYLVTRMLKNQLLGIHKEMTQAAFDSLPSPKVMG